MVAGFDWSGCVVCDEEEEVSAAAAVVEEDSTAVVELEPTLEVEDELESEPPPPYSGTSASSFVPVR